jgi:hypothetical protein
MPVHAFTRRSHCQNCGKPLSGPYCWNCGQLDVDYNRSFWHIVEDGLEGLLHFDGKFFKSARYIFTRPGFLTTEFIAGRRASYTNPFRFYVFASFLFFAVSVLTSHRTAAQRAAAKEQAVKAVAGAVEGVRQAQRDSPEAKKALEPRGADVDAPPKDADKRSWLDEPMRINAGPGSKVTSAALGNEFWHLLPAMLFFCLPLLALVLKLAYIRSGRLYVEHLIFALHVQALAFLSFIVIGAGGWLGSLAGERTESAVGSALLLGLFWLIYRAFRTVYGQGRVMTAFKLGLVLAVYGLILIFGFAGLGVLSIYLVSEGA